MAPLPQSGFIVCVPIKHDAAWPGLAVRTVQEHVEALENPAGHAMRTALDDAGSIHFMSMSVIYRGEGENDPVLLLDISGDGKPVKVLGDLVNSAGRLLLPAFEAACGVQTLPDLQRILEANLLSPTTIALSRARQATGLAFQGTPDLTVNRIRQDRRIAQISRDTVVANPLSGRRHPLDVLLAARKLVEDAGLDFDASPNDQWVQNKDGVIGQVFAVVGAFLRAHLRLVAAVVLVTLALALMLFGSFFRGLVGWERPVALFILAWTSIVLAILVMLALLSAIGSLLAFALSRQEDADRPLDVDPDPESIRQIMERENRCAQNHLTGVSSMKPGFLRRAIFLVIGLNAVELMVRARVFKKGFLADVGTIHFAQWVKLPGSRKLLFLSNYDGSWQSYLEDFITEASPGVTGIWSNTVDFPKTRWLFLKGAADGDRFKRWARRQQNPTLFWYSAYADLTVEKIRKNVKIRRELAGCKTPAEASQWLKHFGSSQSEDVLETHEIQGFALSSYRTHREGCCVPMAFGEGLSAEQCRAQLAAVIDKITFADAPQSSVATFVALSGSGVAKLGFGHGKGPLASGFPAVFTLGMDSPERARVLGDVGINAPSEWDWGGPSNPVDLILLLYAASTGDLKVARRDIVDDLVSIGMVKRADIGLRSLPPKDMPVVEPFGFVDGISQPAIRGISGSKKVRPEDVVNAGEFILGYRDGRELFPPTPQVYARMDLSSLLPDLPPDYPGVAAEEGRRDLGRNGSFLVVRQLRQHVDKYDEFLAQAAGRLQPTRTNGKEWIAAKMVGRWRNGAPLVTYPDAPPRHYKPGSRDDDFLYGRDDPQGRGCPLGAHIRRANPRDAFNPRDATQQFLSNRHRLLRRGRAYESKARREAAEKEEGLVFMCLNADIERQFEFVQQSWISSPSFNGLHEEADPIVAAVGSAASFTIPLAEGFANISDLQSFVTVKGGGYFFLPSRSALQYLAQTPLQPSPKSYSSAPTRGLGLAATKPRPRRFAP